jgi:hypothetical protein
MSQRDVATELRGMSDDNLRTLKAMVELASDGKGGFKDYYDLDKNKVKAKIEELKKIEGTETIGKDKRR